MNKKLLAVMIVLCTALSTGCNNSGSSNTSTTASVNRFEVDITTHRINNYEEEYESTTSGSNGGTSDIHSGNTLGEIEITGEDKSEEYKIDGENIIYNEVTYKGLYSAISNIEFPNDEQTFINFLVKTFNPTSDIVNVIYVTDYDRTEDAFSTSLSQQLEMEWKEYSDVKSKYGSDVMWMLRLYEPSDERVAMLYGNKDYILYQGKSGALEINMNNYNIPLDKYDDILEENTENAGDNTSDTEDTTSTDNSSQETPDENGEQTTEDTNSTNTERDTQANNSEEDN